MELPIDTDRRDRESSMLRPCDRTLMASRPQPVHTRSKTRTRPAASSTANTMNPKSPTSATRRRGPPVGALNTGSYGPSQIPGQQRHEHRSEEHTSELQ